MAFAPNHYVLGLILAGSLVTAPLTAQRGAGGAQVPTVSGMVNGKLGPVVKDGMMQAVTEFADPTQLIKESVWVETKLDSDHDGKPDRIHVGITRPGAAEKAGLKVPILMLSSPYIGSTNGNAPDWDMNQELGDPSPPRKVVTYNPFSPDMRLKAGPTQWVARGFAAIEAENTGTGLSTGCPTVGDSIENLNPKYVIDWLNGRAKAYTTFDGNTEVSATSWSNGKVGMFGVSYEGTMPLAAAVTGVKGLEAIIPISPNTSQYRYYRSNGLVRSPGTYLGEDVHELYDFVHTGRVRERCDSIWVNGIFAREAHRETGDFNQFWADRDQTSQIKNVHAAVLFVHGFNDWNVMPDHTLRMWDALKKINPSAKLYMTQGGHGSPPPQELQDKWWAHYLYGVNNGVDTLPRAMIVQSDAVAPPPPPAPPGTPPAAGGRGGRGGGAPAATFYKDWPIPGTADVRLFLGKGGSTVGTVVLKAAGKQGAEKLIDDGSILPSAMAKAASSPNRLLYALPILKDSVHLSGRPVVTIKMAANKPAVNLSVYLVTLPYEATRIGSGGEVGVITRSWADPQNYKSLTGSQDYTSMKPGEKLVPGKFYSMTFPLQPTDKVIKPGQQLALMVFSSDTGFTMHPKPGSELTLDVDGTSFTIPVLGGTPALKKALGMK